jgi:AcrR family transcriptional regulator
MNRLSDLEPKLPEPKPAEDSERSRPRGGRPPNAMAGEVEERLLEAARSVFLERGYEGATFEQIAEVARAGKATLYARYASKEALFIAVMKRGIDRTLRFLEDVPSTAKLGDRLAMAGGVVLDRCLSMEVLSLMRVVIAEAPRFPVLAARCDENGRRRAIAAVARIIMAGAGNCQRDMATEPPPQAVEAARRFMDMVFAPMVLRGLFGEDLEILRQGAPTHIARAIALATDASGAIFGMRDESDEAVGSPNI